MTKKQLILQDIFEMGVDGRNSNAYELVIKALERLPIEAKRIEITFNDVYEALKPLSDIWDKQIEEEIE